MKEITEEFKGHEAPGEIVAPVRKEKRITGQTMKVPGLTMWDYEMRTGELKKAEFKSVTIEADANTKRQVVHNRLDSKEDHIYFQALNWKTAKRKLEKRDYFVKPLER